MARDVGHERNDRLLELGEDRFELRRRHAWFVAVDQCVVGAILETDGVGDAAIQLDVLLEVRREGPEVLLLPGLLPDRACRRSGAGDFSHQVRRQLDGLADSTPRYPDQASLAGMEQ